MAGLVPAPIPANKGGMGAGSRIARVGRWIAAAGGWLIGLALPPRCPGCGTVTGEDHRFCLPCWQSLDFLAGPACARCGEPFGRPVLAGTECGACLAEPPAFDRVRAAVAYGDVARRLALRLKHGNRPMIARTVAAHMARVMSGLPSDALLVPVPLHRWRLWRRGYNQAALIAQAVGRSHELPVDLDLLVRLRRTPMLRGLGRKQRARTVRGAFGLRERSGLRGRTIVLVDDVLTSGATAHACAHLLKRGGAARVEVLCWARVTRDGEADPLRSLT